MVVGLPGGLYVYIIYIYILYIYIPISFGSIMIHMIINCWWKVHPSRPETWCVFLQCCKLCYQRLMLKIASALGFCPHFSSDLTRPKNHLIPPPTGWREMAPRSPATPRPRLIRQRLGFSDLQGEECRASRASWIDPMRAETFTPPKRGPFQPLSSWWFQPIWKIRVQLEIFPK